MDLSPQCETGSNNKNRMNDFLGLIVGFILTLLVFSYLLGDNPLYRIAIHILVGTSAAYAAVVVIQQVILPVFGRIQENPSDPENLLWFVPIFLVLLLFLRGLPTISWLGNNALAILVGVGAATALVGVILGTLWPQLTVIEPTNALFPGQGVLVAILTACTLLAFQFTGRVDQNGNWTQPTWRRTLSTIGRVLMTITFGVLFASAINTSVILLSERLGYFLTEFLQRIL
jgi:hypothetical protein